MSEVSKIAIVRGLPLNGHESLHQEALADVLRAHVDWVEATKDEISVVYRMLPKGMTVLVQHSNDSPVSIKGALAHIETQMSMQEKKTGKKKVSGKSGSKKGLTPKQLVELEKLKEELGVKNV